MALELSCFILIKKNSEQWYSSFTSFLKNSVGFMMKQDWTAFKSNYLISWN